ncbi:B3 domain-containing protein [Striga asiatica]|uniref:B3 domain-containing protein n=1 Tax=Striga asiatica TaxID=4170 RepID=A0A5A7P744_STRAF|nr:B3 domain-containing protein [Striga asiatica]
MAEQFERFFKYIVNPDKPALNLRDALNHQYSQLIPVQCTITTREGRRYNVTLRGNCFRVVFAEGWLNFVHGEEIKTDNCLWFDRTLFTDFIVTVHTDNQVERPLRHCFTLEIKKTHVERARLEFVEATEMVEGSTLCFTLVPYCCVHFETEVGTCMWQEVLSHSFIDYPLGVFEIHAKTVYLDEDDREEALEFWPLVDHYCSNNPDPLWETLKIIFEPLGLDPYPGETRAIDERNHRKL